MSDYIFHVDVTCKGCGRVGRITDQELIKGRLLQANKARQYRCTVCGAVGEMASRVGFRESVASDGGDGRN